jgi:hypothetical protein
MYALSEFDSQSEDAAESVVPFVSALKVVGMNAESLTGEVLPDEELVDVDLRRVHVVWGMSKDLGSSGIRLVCVFFVPTVLRLPSGVRFFFTNPNLQRKEIAPVI